MILEGRDSIYNLRNSFGFGINEVRVEDGNAYTIGVYLPTGVANVTAPIKNRQIVEAAYEVLKREYIRDVREYMNIEKILSELQADMEKC